MQPYEISLDQTGDLEIILQQNCENAMKALQSFNVIASERKPIAVTASVVRRFIKSRRERDTFLPKHLFADPAWDMLLELYASELDQRRVATSNLCDASAVPPTTALRWIGAIEKEGLIERKSDPLDARRIFVRLSSQGASSMEAYFQRQAGSLMAGQSGGSTVAR